MRKFDITFIGHMCYDEIKPFTGEATIASGSAVLCGAMAAARVGKKVAVITKMSPKDAHILEPMKEIGITTFLIPAPETTYMKVVHLTDNVDEREIFQIKNAGYFSFAEIPEFQSKHVHLAGITDQEFKLDFIKDMKNAGYNLSVDMQSFVRQVDRKTDHISMSDVPDKHELLRYFDKVKLDVVEAKILTKKSEILRSAQTFIDWGSPEIVITQANGVLARANSTTCYERFSNRSSRGRTGRGDTTFAGYLAWRMEHGVEESTSFAAALASIKMESPGPFSGTLKDVRRRMKNHNNYSMCHHK